MAEYRIFPPAPGRCWECGSPSLRPVSDGYDTDFLCESCGSAWHIELGRVARVEAVEGTVVHDPAALPVRGPSRP
jgi:hypothetical protein